MLFDQLKRREFITLLSGAAAWPLAARAQQSTSAPRIGWLAFDVPENHAYFDALRQGLRDLGHAEGQALIIEPRWVSGRDRVPDLARELAALKVRAIVVQGGITTFLRGVIDLRQSFLLRAVIRSSPAGAGAVHSIRIGHGQPVVQSFRWRGLHSRTPRTQR